MVGGATKKSFMDAELMNALARMLAPFQREFGHRLDLTLFMQNPAYAVAVLEQARSSRDDRLRAHAKLVEQKLAVQGNVFSDRKGGPTEGASARDEDEEAMRGQLVERYRRGLR